MYCKFAAGIGEIELDTVIFEHHTVCSTKINKAQTCLINQPYKTIAIARGIGKIELFRSYLVSPGGGESLGHFISARASTKLAAVEVRCSSGSTRTAAIAPWTAISSWRWGFGGMRCFAGAI